MSGLSYEESYLGKLRKTVGREKLLINAARAVVFDEANQLLLIRRRDNGHWAMPSGAMELDESVYDCLVREVHEESGLQVHKATLFAINSNPSKTSIVTAYGDPYQLIVFVFRVDEWSGELITETDETIDARFLPLDELSDVPSYYLDTLEDLKAYESRGQLILK